MSAGYLFSIGSNNKLKPDEALQGCFKNGRYATLLNTKWTQATTATMGDFINMRPGDNVYLFSNRLVYGIGEITASATGEAAVELFPGASDKHVSIPNEFIVELTDSTRCYRWAVHFKPSPFFFNEGVDMDDLLNSNPNEFSALRSFWNRSFIQLDDTENRAFKAAIIRHNEYALNTGKSELFFSYSGIVDEAGTSPNRQSRHQQKLDAMPLLRNSRKADGSLKSEMALEVGVLAGLKRKQPEICNALGEWDYVAHQVTASPFKPVEYMDRIDIFGYRWIEGYGGEIISKYLVVELKKGPAVLKDSAVQQDYNQLMKYVDWVCNKYAHGDYSMIDAVLIAHSFDFSDAELMKEATTRSYVTGRQAIAHVWNDMRYITYNVSEDGKLTLSTF